jgi:hypothetical protein
VTCDIQPFSSSVVPQDPPTANSIRILQQEIQQYLNRLRDAVCALQDRIDQLEQRVTACCGSAQ